jgi:hypothetical protein
MDSCTTDPEETFLEMERTGKVQVPRNDGEAEQCTTTMAFRAALTRIRWDPPSIDALVREGFSAMDDLAMVLRDFLKTACESIRTGRRSVLVAPDREEAAAATMMDAIPPVHIPLFH